jgi:hypothetical protein
LSETETIEYFKEELCHDLTFVVKATLLRMQGRNKGTGEEVTVI